MMTIRILCLLFLIVGCLFQTDKANAQSVVTLAVDMSFELQDGNNRPEDISVYITGDKPPFDGEQRIAMKPMPDNPYHFFVTIGFPQEQAGELLEYRFHYRIGNRLLSERSFKTISIPEEEPLHMPPEFFNTTMTKM